MHAYAKRLTPTGFQRPRNGAPILLSLPELDDYRIAKRIVARKDKDGVTRMYIHLGRQLRRVKMKSPR